ncbi:glycoside hydrolase family 15 protein [Teratosphaeria destructans]|uniref:glucan 1,4-alpha-glucosidase n=1 Tax=Teratosphaeria destructans TaxID=418781 RepID=A0A9W7SPX1_9PEZI|nr:glycoside hydrolase family 15 protein [Teratosphaeria destructans]
MSAVVARKPQAPAEGICRIRRTRRTGIVPPSPFRTASIIAVAVVLVAIYYYYYDDDDYGHTIPTSMRTTTISKAALAALAFAHAAVTQSCDTTTLRSTPPTDDSGTQVALGSYSYCGGTFDGTAYVANLDYNKVVTLYYTNRQNESTPLSSLTFAYSGAIAGTNWERWTTSTPVYIDGITHLLNLTFQATDIGQTYVQTLNRPVTASGAPEPTLPAPPAPYATPEGFGDDITAWLAVNATGETETAFRRMFLNINPAVEGAAKGVVVAARSGPYYDQTDPDYAYNWVRDASLTMDVVQMLYAAATDAQAKSQYEHILFEYACARATEQIDPNLLTGLGEPKFYLNNTIFSGPWGRPQTTVPPPPPSPSSNSPTPTSPPTAASPPSSRTSTTPTPTPPPRP